MSRQSTVWIDRVLRKEGGQVAVHVLPSEDVDLQFVYRAGLSIYWNPAERLIEDRAGVVESSMTSAARIARAIREELGATLQASTEVRWEGFDDGIREQVAVALFG